MYKKYLVRQNSHNDCASACLLSIMKYYGVYASLDEVSYIVKTTNSGTNALNLINGSRTFGFNGFGIHYSYEEITSNQVTFPIICHVLRNNMYHFIVVYKVKKDYLIVMDPSTNIIKLNKKEFEHIYLNTSIVIYPVKKHEGKYENKKLYEFIFDYIKLEKVNILKTIIMSIIVILLSLFSNYYFYTAIDKIIPNYNYKYFIIITIFFINVFLVKDILEYIKNRLFINIETSIYTKLNIDIIRKLFNLPYLFFKSKSTGEVESRINDLKVFKELISEFIISLFINILFVLISFIILSIINIKLLIMNISFIIVYLLVVCIYKIIFNNNTNEILISEGYYNKVLIDNINSYEINKNLNLIETKNKDIEISFIKYINRFKIYENKINNKSLFKNIISDFAYVITIFYGIKFITNNDMSLSLFILFNSIIYYFIEPLKSIFDLNPNFEYLKNTYKRIYDLLIIKEESDELSNSYVKGDINIKDLSYTFNGYDKVFDEVNLSIKYGSKYLIYGSSGNGKSTLIKIILKYINDYLGEIKINNINLRDINKNIISNSFTYVGQNNYLINDTLKNNIIYGRIVDSLEYEKIIDICNLSDLRNNTFRDELLIEDDGFNISGGQRQKIILARSLLKKSNYIILDEALSEVGIDEEKQIIKKLFNIYQDKTIIYISHKKEIIDMFKDKYYLERSKRS